MDANYWFSKQAILNTQQEIADYFLHFELAQGSLALQHAKSFYNALYNIGIENLAESKQLFIQIDDDFLFDNAILTLPRQSIVIGINDNFSISKKAIERLSELKHLNYSFALFHSQCKEDYFRKLLPLLAFVDYFIVDTQHINLTSFEPFKKEIDTHSVVLIANNIQDQESYEKYLNMGFEYFSGPFYLVNDVNENEEIDENYQQTLQLLNTLERSTSMDEIALEFTKAPEISYALLQYLNSPIFNMSRAIKSIRHALMLLGQKNLRKWLLMIAFSQVSTSSNSTNPLLFSVQTRAQLMFEIAKQSFEKLHIQAEEASFVGVLSLLDNLIGVTKHKLFEVIFVDESIKDAVMFEKGILGNMLALSIAIESFDKEKISVLKKELDLSDEQLNEVMEYGYSKR